MALFGLPPWGSIAPREPVVSTAVVSTLVHTFPCLQLFNVLRFPCSTPLRTIACSKRWMFYTIPHHCMFYTFHVLHHFMFYTISCSRPPQTDLTMFTTISCSTPPQTQLYMSATISCLPPTPPQHPTCPLWFRD